MDYSEFKCEKCGNCCRVPGYVRVDEEDIAKIAKFLDLPTIEFIDDYTILTDDRKSLSLIESPGFSCVFYSSEVGCEINSVKPKQCSSFPYSWRYSNLARICSWAKNKEIESEVDKESN